MLHIFLVILKIIGIALLVISGLLVLIVLSVLFVPVKYQINLNLCDNDGSAGVKGQAVFSYFGPFLRARAVYDNDFSWKLKLFCFTLKKGEPGQAVDEEADDVIEETDEAAADFGEKEDNFTVLDLEDDAAKYSIGKTSFEDFEEVHTEAFDSGMDYSESYEDDNSDGTDDVFEDTADKKSTFNFFSKIRHVHALVKNFVRKIKNAFKNINNTLKKIKKIYNELKKLFEDEKFKISLRFVKVKILFFLKKIMPVIKKAEFQFGTNDPALTGQILGAVCIFNGVSRQFIIAEPDFESDKIFVRGEAVLKGKIRLCHVAKLIWYYLFSEEVKYLKYKIEKTRRKIDGR